MNEELKREIETVDASYQRRRKEEAKVWAGFDKEVGCLTERVSQEFKRVLDTLELRDEKLNNGEIKVLDFEVEYSPTKKDFIITINRWGIKVDGTWHSDKNPRPPYRFCVYSYLKQVIGFDHELDSRIIDFKNDFNIHKISYECECGSDHK